MTKYEKSGDIIIIVLESLVIILKNSKKLKKLITKKASKIPKQ